MKQFISWAIIMQAINQIRVDSFKTRNRGAFSGSHAALKFERECESIYSLHSQSDFTLCHLHDTFMGQTGLIKKQIFFCLISPLLLLLQLKNGFHIWRVYIASQVYPLTPSYGSNCGHEIADFLFLSYISFKTTLLPNYNIY